jgi:hypothetical protein
VAAVEGCTSGSRGGSAGVVLVFAIFDIMPDMKTLGIFFMVAFASITAIAEEFAGFWTTIDDESKEKKSVVQVADII